MVSPEKSLYFNSLADNKWNHIINLNIPDLSNAISTRISIDTAATDHDTTL